jgi:hypothetical protein
MSEQIIAIIDGVKSVTKVAENVYTVIDGAGNAFTLNEAQVRDLPTAAVITEGKQIILG